MISDKSSVLKKEPACDEVGNWQFPAKLTAVWREIVHG